MIKGYNAFIPKFKTTTFVTSYIGIAVYLINIFGYKIWRKTKKVDLHSMDLDTGRIEDDGVRFPSTISKAATWVVSKFRN